MDLAKYYDQEWERVKENYKADPEQAEGDRAAKDLMDMIAELEKITKRPSD